MIKNSSKKIDEKNDPYKKDLFARQKFIDKTTAVASKNIELLDQLFKLP